MKGKKSISLFFASMVASLCIGIVIGLNFVKVLNSDNSMILSHNQPIATKEQVVIHDDISIPVTAGEDVITADTDYLILEKNMNTGEIRTKHEPVPEKYIGLNREQVIEHLNDYQLNPPLSELEAGFVSLDLVSFSPIQLEVQKNYSYIEPTGIFYIMSYNHKVFVMLEDKKTVYLSTEISMDELPSEVQQDIMRGLFIPNEECLYDFLETYTS
ncbi:MAG: hypothetical protein IKK33_13130 [Lachnospiraceae bacterium]|nr:hypothetical protein [Lachnospiraceae bacterium]